MKAGAGGKGGEAGKLLFPMINKPLPYNFGRGGVGIYKKGGVTIVIPIIY